MKFIQLHRVSSEIIHLQKIRKDVTKVEKKNPTKIIFAETLHPSFLLKPDQRKKMLFFSTEGLNALWRGSRGPMGRKRF